jgi:hypothetical protein
MHCPCPIGVKGAVFRCSLQQVEYRMDLAVRLNPRKVHRADPCEASVVVQEDLLENGHARHPLQYHSRSMKYAGLCAGLCAVVACLLRPLPLIVWQQALYPVDDMDEEIETSFVADLGWDLGSRAPGCGPDARERAKGLP